MQYKAAGVLELKLPALLRAPCS